jgi:hypothetical protein
VLFYRIGPNFWEIKNMPNFIFFPILSIQSYLCVCIGRIRNLSGGLRSSSGSQEIQTVEKLVFARFWRKHRKTNFLFCYVGTSSIVLETTGAQILNCRTRRTRDSTVAALFLSKVQYRTFLRMLYWELNSIFVRAPIFYSSHRNSVFDVVKWLCLLQIWLFRVLSNHNQVVFFRLRNLD